VHCPDGRKGEYGALRRQFPRPDRQHLKLHELVRSEVIIDEPSKLWKGLQRKLSEGSANQNPVASHRV